MSRDQRKLSQFAMWANVQIQGEKERSLLRFVAELVLTL
jgi:hypothetical protein